MKSSSESRSDSSAASSKGRIALLPEVVRNQIAAGEVIERPASIVREVVENALDAGAGRIQVELEEGGAKLVRVSDDGCGMGPDDLALAFAAHATSKLRDVADLDHIASLGFRGEALASIGSVARCRIFSREAGSEHGYEIMNEGGNVSPVRVAGGPPGTTVEVRELFYNTPARRRFLKKTPTELSRCLDFLQRAALVHEGVGFTATHGGRRLFDVEATLGMRDRIRRLFGAELSEALVEVEAVEGDTLLTGFVAPPRFARGDTARQMWFLNGRGLRDKVLIRCLKDAYRGFLIEGKQPVAFLSLAMDPAMVDVNVHPTKSEVRFREQRRLFGFLVRNLREAVAKTDISTPGETLLKSAQRRAAWSPAEMPGQAALPDPGAFPLRQSSAAPAPDALRVYEVPAARPPGSDQGAGSDPAAAAQASEALGSAPSEVEHGRRQWDATDELRGPFLQIAKTYLVRSVPDGFEIIDQHALHERLTYEGLRAEVRNGKVEVQRLLVPELVELSGAEIQLVEAHAEALSKIGIEVAVFGKTTVAIHGLPARLRSPDAEGVLRDALEVLRSKGTAPLAEDVLEDVLHSTACRSSIMAGDALTEDEIRSLLERSRKLESDQTCPHARPTRVRFTLSDLEKAFHRR